MTGSGRVEPTDFQQRTAAPDQVADFQVRTAAPSVCTDVELIAEVINLARLELLRSQLPKPAALKDRVGKPLVHLLRHVANPVPAGTAPWMACAQAWLAE